MTPRGSRSAPPALRPPAGDRPAPSPHDQTAPRDAGRAARGNLVIITNEVKSVERRPESTPRSRESSLPSPSRLGRNRWRGHGGSRSGGSLPHERESDRAERDPLLMRNAEEAFGAPVATQRIEHYAQRAVEGEIEPEGRAVRGHSRLHGPEGMARGKR